MERDTNKLPHTPGPWIMDCRDEENRKYTHSTNGLPIIAQIGDEERLIADVSHSFVNHANMEEYEANAKLIAAAPELLKVLIGIRGNPFAMEHIDPTRMDEAIKKATE